MAIKLEGWGGPGTALMAWPLVEVFFLRLPLALSKTSLSFFRTRKRFVKYVSLKNENMKHKNSSFCDAAFLNLIKRPERSHIILYRWAA